MQSSMPNDLNKTENYIQGIVFNEPSFNSSKPNFINRIIDSIKTSLFQAPKPPPPVETNEQQKHTHKVLKNLLNIKNELKEKINSDLFDHVEKAIDPIERDAKRIQKMMQSAITNDDSDKTQIKYQQWIKKAERWVELENKLDLQISVIEAIIQQHFCDAEEQIDQDLKLIADYEMHLLSSLSLLPEKKAKLTQIIKQNLSVHVEGLIKLKEKPQSKDLHKVTGWKTELTQKRSHHFENALHKIDATIEQLTPIEEQSEEINPELDLLEHEAENLEIEAIEVLTNEANDCSVDQDMKETLRMRFQWLQKKTHPHHLDHHLSSSQAERLDKISSAIERINKEISQFQ